MTTLPPVDERTRRAWVTLNEREYMRYQLAQEHNVTEENKTFRIVRGSNHERNRYKDVLPYDRTLVSQQKTFGYLNANVVCDLNGRWYVASQAPTAGELRDWFDAIHKRDASRQPALPKQFHREGRAKAAIIVQLTDWIEGGVVKATKYLPEVDQTDFVEIRPDKPTTKKPAMRLELGRKKHMGDVVDRHGKVKQVLVKTVSKIELYSADAEEDKSDVRHFQFHLWPDHGVPQGSAVDHLVDLIFEVDKLREELDDCEVWIHCSAGIGRTGTYIALASLLLPTRHPLPSLPTPLGQLPAPWLPDPVAVTVDAIRDYRTQLVQTERQFQMIYDVLAKRIQRNSSRDPRTAGTLNAEDQGLTFEGLAQP